MSTAVANNTRFPKLEGLELPVYDDIWRGFRYFQTQYAVKQIVKLENIAKPVEVEVFEVEPHTIIDDVLNLQASVLSNAINGHGDEIQALRIFNRNAAENQDREGVNASILMLGLQALNKVQYPASENVNSTTFDTSIQKLIAANDGSFESLVASLDILNATVTSYISEYQETILETLKLQIDKFEQSKLERLFREGRVLHTLGYRISFEKDNTGRIKPIFERADFKLDAQDGKFRLSQKPLETGTAYGPNVTVLNDSGAGFSGGSRNPKRRFIPVALISLFILASCISKANASDMIIPTQTTTPKTDAPLSTDIPVTPTSTPFVLPTNTAIPATLESTPTSIPEATQEPSTFARKLLARMETGFPNYGPGLFDTMTAENKGVREVMSEICLHLDDPKWLEENLQGFPNIIGIGHSQGSMFPKPLSCKINKESVAMLEKLGFKIYMLYFPDNKAPSKNGVFYTRIIIGDVPDGTQPQGGTVASYADYFALDPFAKIEGDFPLTTGGLDAFVIARTSAYPTAASFFANVATRNIHLRFISADEHLVINQASFAPQD